MQKFLWYELDRASNLFLLHTSRQGDFVTDIEAQLKLPG